MASITLKDLHIYHSIDREVFTRLVISLMRDPAQSMLIIATWLYLEDTGFPNIIMVLMSLTNEVVNALADEAVACYNTLASDNPPPAAGGMLVTSSLVHQPISLRMVYRQRFSAIIGIKNILSTVCARIFTDILQHVLGYASGIFPDLGQPLFIPGFPHPVYGDVTVMPRAIDHTFPIGGLWGWNPMYGVTEDDRTMFLTFSRGFPVTQDEVLELFTSYFGDCVQAIHMQINYNNTTGQSLFARMILRSITTVDRILNGEKIAKFKMHGKHVWARKYERRD